MPVRASQRFVDGHKGKRPINNVLNNTTKNSEPTSCDPIKVTEQQPVKEDNKIKCVKISINVVSTMQENTILITVGG